MPQNLFRWSAQLAQKFGILLKKASLSVRSPWQDIWGISANINPFFGLIITHSCTNSSTVVKCHCRTALPDSCLRLMVFQSRRSLFNSSNCKTSKSMMCEAPIQMSYNKHKLTLIFHRNTYCRLPSRNTCYNLES